MKEAHRGVSPQLNSSSNSVVTKPVGQSKHIKRTQQIKALHNQFEALKKKIKDVQSKNEKIIENIHKQYDFKKKPQTTNFMIEADPVVHYDEQIEGSIPSVQNKHHHSDSENDFKGKLMVKKASSNIKKNQQPAFHQSIEYRKAQNHTDQRDQSEISSMKNNSRAIAPNQFSYSANSQYVIPQQMSPQQQFQISQFSGMNPYQQYSMQFPVFNNPNLAMSTVGTYYGNPNHSYQLEENLVRQRQRIKILQEQLKILKRSKEKSMEYYEDMLQPHFVDFINDSMVKRFSEMEKYIKKNENKVKKIQLKLKDFRQAQMSRRIIEQHRSKRSHSRSKRQNSPRTNYNSLTSVPRIPSKKASQSLVVPNEASKSKQSEQSKSSQQFQEIANQYQEIIKIKTKEVEAYQQRLRQKERELLELGAKCSKLQMKISQLNQSTKMKKNRVSQRQENLLSNLDFGNEKQTEIISLNKKINQLQIQLQQKQKEIQTKDQNFEKSNKKLQQYQSKTKRAEVDMNKLKQQLKKFQKQSKTFSSLGSTLKKLQLQLQAKDSEYSVLREKCSRFQNDKIQKQCENLTLTNKIKKIQSVLMVKQQKILQLEKIIQSSVGGNQGGDLLQKSMYLEKIDHNDLQSLQQEKDQLEEELVEQREQIFFLQKDNQTMEKKCRQIQQECNNLKKDVQNLQIQNESIKINLKAQQFQKYKIQISNNPLQKLLQQGDCVSENEQDEHILRQQLQQIKRKYEQTQILLKSLNQKSFQENRKVLKLTSELNYFKQQLSDREDRYQKLRKQYEQVKCQISSLQQNIYQKDNELEVQRKINSEKLKQIENQWLEFEQEVRNKQVEENSHDVSDLRNSHHFSEESFVNYRSNYTSMNAENQRLLEKLKQSEKIIEVQKQMEEKIVKEYRNNVERIKTELREKIKQNERLMEDSQNFKRRIRVLEQNEARLKQIAKGGQDENLLDGSNQRVVQLELQLNEMREINNKLEAMEQELFNQISEKDKEIQSIIRNLTNRQKRIEELQDIIELKQMNFSSHISTSQHKSKIRQSLQSQSSLRYSMLSNTQNPRDKTMQLELSEAGESFFDQNQSMVSNVSEVFGRQQFPYEKMQLKRVQQRKLFQKTAAYIKSLKKAIDEKSKKIKILEKKIESLRNSQLIRKDIYQIKQVQNFDDLQPDNDDIFKDYYSVQLQRSHSQRYRIKQLQHETKLTIEQNNLLNNQIERIQEDLLRSEEQENSLIKMKDLYKEEIKNILKQNQDQAKLFEQEMKKMRGKMEQSQSLQKMEALKQIYIKIIQCLVAFQAQSSKSKRKQQRRKQLQDFLKVCANLLNYDQSTRQKLLSEIVSIKSQKK